MIHYLVYSIAICGFNFTNKMAIFQLLGIYWPLFILKILKNQKINKLFHTLCTILVGVI